MMLERKKQRSHDSGDAVTTSAIRDAIEAARREDVAIVRNELNYISPFQGYARQCVRAAALAIEKKLSSPPNKRCVGKRRSRP